MITAQHKQGFFKPRIGEIAMRALRAGASNEQALAEVKKVHPDRRTNLNNIGWYRSQLRLGQPVQKRQRFGKVQPMSASELRAFCETTTWSQEQLADMLGVSARAFRRWLAGHSRIFGSSTILLRLVQSGRISFADVRAARTKAAVRPAATKVTKTALIACLLKRQNGCTRAEVLALTGWPSVSMRQQAEAAGLTLRQEKIAGYPTRYYGA